MPLRVALDATPILRTPTGVGAFVAGALAALAARDDIEVRDYALSRRGAHARRAPLPARALLRLWERLDVPPVEWWAGSVDVVHGTNFVVPPARRAGRVATVHDLTPVRFPELASPTTRRFPALVRRAVERGALVHTPSAFVAAEVVDLLGADPDRVAAVHHGVPPVAPAPTPPDVPRPYVLALGTVEPRKDLPSLVRAFDALAAAHADLHLVVAGPDGWGADALASAVEAARHSRRIRRLPWVGDAERAGLLRHAAAFAYPSRYEGFGLPPLEAMSVDVPVVATSVGAVPEVVGDGAVLVPPGDADALAEALARVLTDDEVRTALVARGRRRAASFSWDACADGLARIYRRAAG
ncbi:MAG TPA: glycosyltransferase family 1 protein [Acidimicrobiales bacterium]|nr:glycosyltransferase family 1 protein [Acidimicrobiales bacterium]